MKIRQRAFLKWAGGKFRLIDDIEKHLPDGACLVEPFVGAGSVFLNTQFERYLLADINPDLINLFNVIKQDVEHYLAHIQPIFFAKDANTPEFYNEQRRLFNASRDPFQRSVLFLYLNRFGFNGLCRYNKKNQYNVPFGRYKEHYFPEKELRFFAQKAQYATFVCTDFTQVFQHIFQNPDNYVVYCDPPYAPISQTTNFTQYAMKGFSLAQQERLAEYAREAQHKGIPVMISNHSTPFTHQIYHNAEIKTLKVQRSISKAPHMRGKVDELLALFY